MGARHETINSDLSLSSPLIRVVETDSLIIPHDLTHMNSSSTAPVALFPGSLLSVLQATEAGCGRPGSEATAPALL